MNIHMVGPSVIGVVCFIYLIKMAFDDAKDSKWFDETEKGINR